jgi:hypothetical protein
MGKPVINQLFEDANGDPLALTISERETPKRKKVWKRHYTMVPDAWKRRLLNAKRTSTYHLVLELLYLHWQNGGKPVVASDKVATAAGLSPRSKSNALAELKRLGLVRVERGPGKAPRVTLLRAKTGK